jgi:formylglycine-generating enzyme required for sulfatase activity
MSYCINPTCPAPTKNSSDTNFCMSCGAEMFIKDRYRAKKLIGQGGFGKTFKAVDEYQSHKPLCAIKQFTYHNHSPKIRQAALDLFYAEARHLESLGKHPQIPELFDYFDIDSQPYLVQQFIDGQDLQQELATLGTFNQTKIYELLRSLLPVLDFLHHQSPPIIHRDIKPANIIRQRSDGGLVLVDFGAAKQATQTMLAQTGTVIGSPEYVAPEQTRGKPAFASDIYSLGVTCIYLLTQVSPFDLFDLSQDAWVWRDYLVDNPVDERLGKVLDRMIVNALPQRYRSAATVLSTLNDNCQPAISLDNRTDRLRQKAQDHLAIDVIAKAPAPEHRQSILARVRAYLTIDVIGRNSHLDNCQSIDLNDSNCLQLQPFSFETAKLTNGKNLWGGTEVVVKKSQGKASRFFQNLGSGISLQMVSIPGGTFLMGAPAPEEGSSDSQRPQHRVSIAPFYLGKYPVTQAQYEVVMGLKPAYFQGGDRPVETVSWHDAVEFCQKLSQRTHQSYRLPSEAEWEYACRAGTTTPFYFGETIDPAVVNYQGAETTIVGSFPANNYGLYDMHGNILEWCADKYHGNYIDAPADGSVWDWDSNGTQILRGGSWYSKSSYCRSAARNYHNPDRRFPYFGFRVCLSLLTPR